MSRRSNATNARLQVSTFSCDIAYAVSREGESMRSSVHGETLNQFDDGPETRGQSPSRARTRWPSATVNLAS